VAAGFFGLLMGYGLLLLLGKVADLYWPAGATVSALSLAFVAFVVVGSWRQQMFAHKSEEPSWLVPALVFFYFYQMHAAVAGFSYSLAEPDVFRYSADGDPVTVERISTLYLWHLVDTIPGLEIWKLFEVSPPVEVGGFWTRLQVLVYRVLLVTPIIWLARQWWKSRTE
jgi:hypothetical protein